MTLGADPSVSAGLLLLVELNEQVVREYFHIRGGNDQLPGALATLSGGSIRHPAVPSLRSRRKGSYMKRLVSRKWPILRTLTRSSRNGLTSGVGNCFSN